MINIDKPSTIRSAREVSAVAVTSRTRTAEEIGAGGEELCCIGLVNPQLCAHYLQELGRKRLVQAWRGL